MKKEMKMNIVNYKSIEARSFLFDAEIQTISINSSIRLISVSEIDKKICVGFVHTSNYEPNVGVIRIEGDVLIDESDENRSKAISEWKNSNKKSIPKDLAEKVHNIILSSCMVEVTVLSREIKLPPPFQIPQVNLEKKESSLTAVSAGSETSYIR